MDVLQDDPELELRRAQAAELLRSFERGDAAARGRVRAAGLERGSLALEDARRVVAREHGCRTWSELAALIESRRRYAPAHPERFAPLLAAFESARARFGERGEARLESGLRYGATRPLVVRARRSPGHYAFDDEGGAVEAAGRPRGWREAAAAVAEEAAMNMNRRGVVSIGAVERHETPWLHSLAARLADTSLAVYEALLELEGAEEPARRGRRGRPD